MFGLGAGDVGLTVRGLDQFWPQPVSSERSIHVGLARLQLRACTCSWHALSGLGANGPLHLNGRALAQGRLDPEVTAVHLNNLLGDSEAKACSAFDLRVRAIDLMELLEVAGLMLFRKPGPVSVTRRRSDR